MTQRVIPQIRLFNGTGYSSEDPLMLVDQCVSSMENDQKPYYNRVASCIVDAGTWLLYNGDNYSHGAVILPPGEYTDLGQFLHSSTSLRSIRPLPSPSDATLVLFQDTNFCGNSLVLNRDCEDLTSVDSREDLCQNAASSFGVSSAIVVSGKWMLYTKTGYDGDSQTVFHKDSSNGVTPTGTYPTLDHNDGTKSASVAHAQPSDGWTWMASLPDALLLSQLTIPGTHDSGAIRGSVSIEDDISQCQYMTASEQLNAGIRFLDIRLVHDAGDLEVFHGPEDERTSFYDWCLAIGWFLNLEPNECVIVSIDDVGGSDPNTFQAAVAEQLSQFARSNKAPPGMDYRFDCFTANEIPALGEVRGKVVILRRFNYAGQYGWACSTNWTHTTNSFQITLDGTDTIIGQDNYDLAQMEKPTMDTKWSLIDGLLDSASSDQVANHLYINFVSGAGDKGSWGSPWPVVVALGPDPANVDPSVKGMNYRLLDLLKNNRPSGRLGIIAMDFPDKPAGLLDAIIACNNITRS